LAKNIDQLAKDIATGMSRRKAFGRFAGGMGAAFLALLSRRPAQAEGNDICVAFCRSQGASGRDFGQCVSFSAHCGPGECAWVLSGTPFCTPVVN